MKRLTWLMDMPCTVVLYESPHRVGKLLNQLDELGHGERRVSLSRELSKLHEETLRGSVKDLLGVTEASAPRGEYVVVIEGTENLLKTRAAAAR